MRNEDIKWLCKELLEARRYQLQRWDGGDLQVQYGRDIAIRRIKEHRSDIKRITEIRGAL